MTNPDLQKRENITIGVFIFSIVLVSMLFYFLNKHFPLYMDDWGYSFTNTGEATDSFWDIICSEYHQYMEWGGRSIVHVIARTLLWFGETWNNILNTIAYTGLVLLMYFIANRQKTINIPLFFIINILIWFTLPSISQNLLWITGSANYLWGCLIIFGLIIAYVNYFFQRTGKDSIAKRIGFFFFGIVAGWTNENMGIALIFFLIIIILYLKYEKAAISHWLLWGLAGVIAGYIVMMVSPGNAYRSRVEFMAIHKIEEVPLSFYFYRFITVVRFSWTHLFYPALLYIIMLALFLWKGKNNKEEKRRILFLSLLFLATSVVATVVMSGSPSFPPRAWFGIIILLITAIVILYANTDFSDLKLKIANFSILSVIVIIYFISFVESYTELLRFESVCLHRDKLVDEAIQLGEKDIVIEDVLFTEKESPLVVLDLKDWLVLESSFAERYGHYKGVKSIKVADVNLPAENN